MLKPFWWFSALWIFRSQWNRVEEGTLSPKTEFSWKNVAFYLQEPVKSTRLWWQKLGTVGLLHNDAQNTDVSLLFTGRSGNTVCVSMWKCQCHCHPLIHNLLFVTQPQLFPTAPAGLQIPVPLETLNVCPLNTSTLVSPPEGIKVQIGMVK